MRLLVLDSCSGRSSTKLYGLSADSDGVRSRNLQYAPEMAVNGDGVWTCETELCGNRWWSRSTRCWLRRYDPSSLRKVEQTEIAFRPMSTGYPGRSQFLAPACNKRFVYVLRLTFVPREPLVNSAYRHTVCRFDRDLGRLEVGELGVESCLVAMGVSKREGDAGDDDVVLHLACDYPSTVAVGRFQDAEPDWLRLEDLAPREHSAMETIASWFDVSRSWLYCVNGAGDVYRVDVPARQTQRLGRLPLPEGSSVALQQLTGAAGALYVGVSETVEERSLGLFSAVWKIQPGPTLTLIDLIFLPAPAINFVVSRNGAFLAAVNPYSRTVLLFDTEMGKTARRWQLGVSPSEVQFHE